MACDTDFASDAQAKSFERIEKMRVGQNPAKSMQDVVQPAPVTVAVVTYIPMLGGYYEQSLEVLKLCLGSLLKNTEMDFDLMVFDNASCPEVQDYLCELKDAGKINYLVLSEKNVGKAGAWNFMFRAAPGEFLAFADSDVYHYKGWLTAQVEALRTFPKLGMVTGMPMMTPEKFSTATVEWAEKEGLMERGFDFGWEDFWRHAMSLGGDEEKSRQFMKENDSLRVTFEGKHYFIGASHFQFVARTDVLREMTPIASNRPMGQVRLLDEAINAAGYLRLCLDKWYVQHMGNTVPVKGFLLEEDLLDGKAAVANVARKGGIWQIGIFRKILQKVYDRSFEILYKN